MRRNGISVLNKKLGCPNHMSKAEVSIAIRLPATVILVTVVRTKRSRYLANRIASISPKTPAIKHRQQARRKRLTPRRRFCRLGQFELLSQFR